MISRLLNAETTSQYASATLVYDPRLLSADPELKGFVTDRAADHPALKLKVRLYHLLRGRLQAAVDAVLSL